MRPEMQNGAMNGGTGGSTLQLPANLDLATAEGLLNSVRQRARGEMPLRIDASGVETLTLPCVQILLAAARDHGRISVKDPSAAFLGAFDDLGIDWASVLDRVEGEFHEQSDQSAVDASAAPNGFSGLEANGGHAAAPVETTLHDAQPINERTMRIMTIDDSKTMRDMLMLTLTEAGFDVLQAVDGQDGLAKLATERVDVVITDINMPKMDGYEVVRRLRGDPAYRSTPILVLTTEGEAEKRDIARKAGASGWMVKPFDPDRLVEAVRKVVQ
jgi:two-component system, chemotaxis family, chemotaxis protein CheY